VFDFGVVFDLDVYIHTYELGLGCFGFHLTQTIEGVRAQRAVIGY